MSELKTIEEAEGKRQELTLDIQNKQAQLGEKHRTDDNGQRLSKSDYWEWRKRAQKSLNQVLDELRVVKAKIRELRPARKHQPSAIGVIVGLLGIIDTVEDDFTPYEQARIQSAREMVATASVAS